MYLPEKVTPRVRGELDARLTFDNLYDALNCMYQHRGWSQAGC